MITQSTDVTTFCLNEDDGTATTTRIGGAAAAAPAGRAATAVGPTATKIIAHHESESAYQNTLHHLL